MKTRNEEDGSAYVAPAIETVIEEQAVKREVHYAGGGITDIIPPP